MNESAYRVDGEIGRFQFAVHDGRDAAGEEVFAGRELLPRRQGRQGYQTDGFQELALFFGAAQSSSRPVAVPLNRWRRQEQDAEVRQFRPTESLVKPVATRVLGHLAVAPLWGHVFSRNATID